MTSLEFVSADRLQELVPMDVAIDALEEAFASEPPTAPQRTHLDVGSGDLLLMPAWGAAGMGVKLITVNPGNPQRGLPLINGLYVLFDPTTLEPRGVIDGSALTALRTAAVSGLATRYLAPSGARRLVLFGAGTQATSHLEAMRTVRPIEEVVVVSRSQGPAERLAEGARGEGLDARVGDANDVSSAQLICTCTTSDEPVFDGARLSPGAHVNAVGAYKPTARELDDEVARRARIVVEKRAAALAEAGDLLIPIRRGVIDESAVVADLAELVSGAPVRSSEDDITVFKSVGMAVEDLAVARAAVEGLTP